VNLSDNEVVQTLCEIIDQRHTLIHLDVSWAKLSPKQLNMVMTTFAELDLHTLKNLNISYNSLVQPPQDETVNFNAENPELQASRDFVENLCAFM
jgi:type II secretory pathway component PulM